MALSPKQQLFVQEYIVDLNATAAARRAGYVDPNTQGPRLLVNVGIQEAIQAAMAARSRRTEIKADRVLQELATVGFSDVGDILDMTGQQPRLKPVNQISESARRAIASFKTKRYTEGAGEAAREVEVTEFKLWSKDAALEKMMKHLRLFAPTDHNLKIEGELQVKDGTNAIANRLESVASVIDQLVSRQAAGTGDTGRNGVHESLDS